MIWIKKDETATYLGVEIGCNQNDADRKTLEKIQGKMTRCFNFWRAQGLSWKGLNIAIRSMIASHLWYVFPLIGNGHILVKKVIQMQKKLFKLSLIPWEVAVVNRCNGGLECPDYEAQGERILHKTIIDAFSGREEFWNVALRHNISKMTRIYSRLWGTENNRRFVGNKLKLPPAIIAAIKCWLKTRISIPVHFLQRSQLLRTPLGRWKDLSEPWNIYDALANREHAEVDKLFNEDTNSFFTFEDVNQYIEVSGFRTIKDSLKQAYDRIISKLDALFGTALRAPPNKIMIGDCINLNNEGVPDEGIEDNTHYLHHFIVEKFFREGAE
eukprot:Nk52_evm5s289 gene=Nk52_evmTU5s289